MSDGRGPHHSARTFEVRTSTSHPQRIDALTAGPAGGLIGITFCPGKSGPSLSGFEWRRDLDADLSVIADWHPAAVVTLIEEHEFRMLGVERLGQAVKALGMQWHHLPIKDGHAPDERFEGAWTSVGPALVDLLRAGGRLVVHCKGGLGRAGTVGARLLIDMGEQPHAAIKRIRDTRTDAIETRDQAQYLLDLVRRPAEAARPAERTPRSRPTQSWFRDLVGFDEDTGAGGYQLTQSRLAVEGDRLKSLVNNKTFGIGRLELLSAADLKHRAQANPKVDGARQVRIVRGDAGHLHARPENQGALFQVASQFNLLEMTGPGVTPEAGVSGYANDNTQGPACAIAAGAATIYRNYFAPVGGQIGQRSHRQFDGLAALTSELGRRLGAPAHTLLSMKNGYAMFEPAAVDQLSRHLYQQNEQELEALRQMLRIGVQWDVEVTSSAASTGQRVTQAFCSALPIGYHHGPQHMAANWEPLARLVLDALYEATLWAAVVNAQNGGSRTVLLTFVGGGVFQNQPAWIRAAIERAIKAIPEHNLDIAIVFFDEPGAQDLAWVVGLARIGQEPESPEIKVPVEDKEASRGDDDPAADEGPSATELRSQLLDLSRYPSDWRKVLGQLVTSVGYCEQAGSSAWSVTLREARYRLNVGNVEVMTTTLTTMDAKTFGLPRDRTFADVRVLVSGPEAAELAVRLKERCGVQAERYATAGGPHWSIRMTIPMSVSPSDPEHSSALEDLAAVQAAHRHFVEQATRTPTGKIRQTSNYRRTHCAALYDCAVGFAMGATRPRPYRDLLWDEDILPEHVPAPEAPWSDISAFALTFDGDPLLFERPQTELELATRSEAPQMHDLRLWLYGAQRGWRWAGTGEAPPAEAMKDIRRVIDLIRRQVIGKVRPGAAT